MLATATAFSVSHQQQGYSLYLPYASDRVLGTLIVDRFDIPFLIGFETHIRRTWRQAPLQNILTG
jgi:hypothetical protein